MTDNYRRFNVKCIKIAVLIIPFTVFLITILPFMFNHEKKGLPVFIIILTLFIISIIYAVLRRALKWE